MSNDANQIQGVIQAPELLLDGGFEQARVGANSWGHQANVGGWRSDSEIEVWGKNFYGLQATEGDKFAELDYDRGASNIYQDVATEAGTEYTFSFDFMKRPDSAAGSDTIDVYWNGVKVGTVDPSKPEWSHAEFKVTGTGGNDRIEFREQASDNDSYGGLIDNASLKRSGPTQAEREEQARRNNDGNDDHRQGDNDHDDDHRDRDDDHRNRDDDHDDDRRNNDDDQHDGRGHGDGDHNDDGHDDNGQGGNNQRDVLTLTTTDVVDAQTGDVLVGDRNGNGMNGGVGNDELAGLEGNDVLHGDRDGVVTIPLDIRIGLEDRNASESLSVQIFNVPAGAVLSAGVDNGDGSWTLRGEDLAGLTLTGPDSSDFTLRVVATTNGESNLTATSEIHVTLSGGTDDILVGNKGNDELFGDAGDDIMFGGSRPTGTTNTHTATYDDNDVLRGGSGNDQMWGNSGDDQIFGEADNDTIFGGKGNDLVDGGDGNDVLAGNTGDDKMLGGAGDDVVNGNSGNDWLSDGDGSDRIDGSSGDDTVLAGAGDDVYNGGSGFDTIDFSDAKQGMTIDLSKKVADGNGHDALSNFEQVIGSSFDDTMKGSKSAETLVGGAGDDFLRGLGGADTLTGGEGRDTFAWLAKDVVDDNGNHLGVDHVTDFSAEDALDFSKLLSGMKWSDIDEVVSVRDDGNSAHVYAMLGQQWVEVAVLDGVQGMTANDMLKSGMLLA